MTLEMMEIDEDGRDMTEYEKAMLLIEMAKLRLMGARFGEDVFDDILDETLTAMQEIAPEAYKVLNT